MPKRRLLRRFWKIRQLREGSVLQSRFLRKSCPRVLVLPRCGTSQGTKRRRLSQPGKTRPKSSCPIPLELRRGSVLTRAQQAGKFVRLNGCHLALVRFHPKIASRRRSHLGEFELATIIRRRLLRGRLRRRVILLRVLLLRVLLRRILLRILGWRVRLLGRLGGLGLCIQSQRVIRLILS